MCMKQNMIWKGGEGTTLAFSSPRLCVTGKSDRLLGTPQHVGQPLREAHLNKVPKSWAGTISNCIREVSYRREMVINPASCSLSFFFVPENIWFICLLDAQAFWCAKHYCIKQSAIHDEIRFIGLFHYETLSGEGKERRSPSLMSSTALMLSVCCLPAFPWVK